MKKLEKQYTSTEYKLMRHPLILRDIKEGRFKPLHVEIAPTNACNLKCGFCSVENRDRKQMISFDGLKKTITEFISLGTRAISWTGGGDPTLYPYINEAIEYTHNYFSDKEYKISQGMITNGVELNKRVDYTNIQKLKWIRVSLNSLDQVSDIKLNIPKTTKLGFSYVISDKNSFTKEKLDKLEHYLKHYQADYLRLVPNCSDIDIIEYVKQTVPAMLKGRSDKDYKIFLQSKSYEKPENCWWGYLKPFVNADGYIYRCSANPLIDRKFSEKHKLGKMEDIREIWSKPKVFKTDDCGLCFYKDQNDLVDTLTKEMEHEEFI